MKKEIINTPYRESDVIRTEPDNLPVVIGSAKSIEEFEPLWDFCVLEYQEVTMTDGGIAIPETAQRGHEDTKRGLCVKAGPGAYRDNGEFVPNPIKVGDIVYFMSYKKPFVLDIAKKRYLVLPGRDAVGIVPRKPG